MGLIKKLLRKIKRLIEHITNTTIIVKRQPRVIIDKHPYAVNDGSSMQVYAELVEEFCLHKPLNIFEIGANYAQDSEFLRKSFEIDVKNVYVFEPHPQIYIELKKLYSFNAYQLAVSNENGLANFNAIDIENNEYANSGISSLREGLTTNKNNFINVEVQTIRMEDFIRKNNIQQIDFLKIDVEGMNYEVLEGFADKLSIVKVIQTEGEYKQYWKGQKTYQDMHDLLASKNFKLVYFKLSNDGIQSDSLWIQEKYLKQAIK